MTGKADRLYDLLPAIHRIRDAERGYPLRALLQVIGEQVNIVEADIRQLYDNWFIETCEDWVVPYIGELVGYNFISDAGELGNGSADRDKILVPRRDVADTIRNRRRKGALALLEELAADVAGWPSRAVEFYKLLGWTQNINHVDIDRVGTVDLRGIDSLDRLGGAFDQAAHTLDLRRINSTSRQGRFNIPSVGLYVWRMRSYPITGAQAHCEDRQRHHYTFSILGNDIPLFFKTLEEPSPGHVAGEMNVPTKIRRVNLQENLMDYYGTGKSLVIYRDSPDRAVLAEDIVVADLSDWEYQPTGQQVAVDPRLGRIAFSSRRPPQKGVWVSYYYGFSADIGGGAYNRIVRTSENVISVGAKEKTKSISDAIDGWREYRDRGEWAHAVIEITDNGCYTEQITIELFKGERLELRAAVGKRPVIRLLDFYSNRPDSMQVYGYDSSYDPRVEPEPESDHDGNSREAADGQSEDGGDDRHGESNEGEYHHDPGRDEAEQSPEELGCDDRRDGRLILDGLLIAGRGVQITGKLESVMIRHSTLVPGWSLDCDCMPEFGMEPSLELIDCTARLTIEHSILGAIQVVQNEVATDPLVIDISDSILDATDSDIEALGSPKCPVAHAVLRIRRTTVIGRVEVHAIELAENSIFDGVVKVARRQTGCMRFCYCAPNSRTPRRFNCQSDMVVAGASDDAARATESLRVRPQFNSTRYGKPDYCQLALNCAEEIKRGADTESEMGAFHNLFQPQREANLRARLEEYTPAGMNVGIIFTS
jgi:hypothetical protein